MYLWGDKDNDIDIDIDVDLLGNGISDTTLGVYFHPIYPIESRTMKTKEGLMQESHKTADEDSPRSRFVKMANTRVNRVLEDLRLVGKLSSDRYEYGPEDVRRIVDALQGAVDAARMELENRPSARTDLTIIPE